MLYLQPGFKAHEDFMNALYGHIIDRKLFLAAIDIDNIYFIINLHFV